jgi:2-methylaconitate cis-trans-isomerase PrpF
MCHESMAGTGAICTTARSRIPGTIVSYAIGEAVKERTFKISHPVGIISTLVQLKTRGIRPISQISKRYPLYELPLG